MATLTGSQIPFAVSLALPTPLTMDDIDFEVTFWIYSSKTVTFSKAAMTRNDENNYQCTVDTAQLGRGRVNCKVAAHIPDDTLGIGRTRVEIVSHENIMEIK